MKSVGMLIRLRMNHRQKVQAGGEAGIELDRLPGEPRGSRHIADAVKALCLPELSLGIGFIHAAKRLGLALL